jgi:hypothetical protein
MDSQDGGVNLLEDFMAPSVEMPVDLSSIDISLLVEPYQYFSWSFAHLMEQDSTSHIPGSFLYVLYFSFQKEAMFTGIR